MVSDCNLHQFERNRYFYGKLLTVRDFEVEQTYYKDKDRLINQLIHGIGIAYGLEISNPQLGSDGKLTIELAKGAALDCCGREIIVSRTGRVNAIGECQDGNNYIYIMYDECENEPVPCLSNSSAGHETCCSNRIKECYKIMVSTVGPSVPETTGGDEINWDPGDELVRPYLDKQDGKVLLAVLNRNGDILSVLDAETRQFRDIVYHNPLLHYLFICLKKNLDSHLSDTDNPHSTSAAQVGALVSIDGVSNPGGNVDLAGNNSITINSDNNTNIIQIGETHSGTTGNPHNTTHAETGPAPIDPASDDSARDKHVSNADGQRWNSALNGIQVGETVLQNPGGAVKLVAGENVGLVPDATGKSVTINASGGASTPYARTGRVTIETNEKGQGSAVIDSGFENSQFFVQVGVVNKGYIEYGPSTEFAGHVLNPIVRVYDGTSLPVVELPTIGPTRVPLAETSVGQFAIIIDAPEIGVQSITLCWFAIPARGHIIPTLRPTIEPTIWPTIEPTLRPTIEPTIWPTIEPTLRPTIEPTIWPTIESTLNPTLDPTLRPTIEPTIEPTGRPVIDWQLTDVSGIGDDYVTRLKENRISSVKELAEAEPSKIAEILGISEVKGMAFVDEARRLLG